MPEGFPPGGDWGDTTLMAGRNGSSLENLLRGGAEFHPTTEDILIARDVDTVAVKVGNVDEKVDALSRQMTAQHTNIRDEIETRANQTNRRITVFAVSLFTASLSIIVALVAALVAGG